MLSATARATVPADVCTVFAALGDPTRLTIVRRLCDTGPLATVRLADGAKLSRQGITKHLRTLEGAGLVHADRVGRDCIWELRKDRLAEIRSYIDEISAQWDEALARLRAAVER
jgi:DNA-binding transcriptional ArsR family regulator